MTTRHARARRFIGHYGGAIANNFVMANDPRLFASSGGFDTGIGLEQSCETAVLHNTIASTVAPRSSSIEWRFANTSAMVANNLVTHGLLPRDGGRATVTGNVANAPLTLFVDLPSGNLRLLPNAIAAIDKAAALDVPLPLDIDGDSAAWPPMSAPMNTARRQRYRPSLLRNRARSRKGRECRR